MGRGWTFPALAAIDLQLSGISHYVGGLAALTLNGLTDQQHTSLIDVFTVGFRRPRRVSNVRARFHRRRPTAFTSGLRVIEVDRFPVTISDAERTLVDCLDQFRIVGGMHVAMRLFRNALPKVNQRKLIEDALRTARRSTCQRIGLLLERERAPRRLLDRLRREVIPATSIHLLIPGRPRVGTMNLRWGILENDHIAR